MRISRIRQMFFIVVDKCAKSLQAYIEIRAILGLSLYEIVFEYTESILACKRIRLKQINILGEYAKNIQLYIEIEYTDRHKTGPNQANFRPKPNKFQIRNHLSIHDRMGKQTSHATVPLNILFTNLNSSLLYFMVNSKLLQTAL